VSAVLGATFIVQMSLRSYVPGMYWLVVALMNVVAASATGLLTHDLEIRQRHRSSACLWLRCCSSAI
jgi:uncharacterized membrane-anchored protein